jgi:hypothetical protein
MAGLGGAGESTPSPGLPVPLGSALQGRKMSTGWGKFWKARRVREDKTVTSAALMVGV